MVRPGYKRTDVGEIPEDWRVAPLLTLARVATGQVDPRVEPYRSMILVAPDHIESATGRLLGTATAADQRAISGKYLFAKGDIVYSKIRPYLRKAILATFDGLCSADMYPLKPAPGVAAGLLLAIVLSNRFTDYAESVSVRSGMPKINRTELADYSAAVPPTAAEQAAIANAVAAADKLIESLEYLLAKKRAIKQGAMQSLLTGARRLPGFTEPWSSRKLSDLAEIRGGGTPSTARPDFWDGDIPWCTPTDITALKGNKYLSSTSRSITNAGLSSSSAEIIPPNSLVMTTRATIGECAINTIAVCTNQGFKSFVPYRDTNVEFLYYLLSTHKAGFVSLCGGSTFLEIGKAQLRAYSVHMPASPEQASIAEVLSDLDADLDATTVKLEKARAIKQGMMQELLTGRIRLV